MSLAGSATFTSKNIGEVGGLAMRLQDILSRKGAGVCMIAPEATADDAVAELVRYNIGSLMVCQFGDDGQPRVVLGIITERDILRAQAAHRAPLEALLVANVMTTELVTARPSDSVEEAMRLMTEHRVRHLPIIADGQLAGMVSIGDIIKAQFDELVAENFYMRSYIQGEGAEVATTLEVSVEKEG
jgi:CBS domain-containing protein